MVSFGQNSSTALAMVSRHHKPRVPHPTTDLKLFPPVLVSIEVLVSIKAFNQRGRFNGETFVKADLPRLRPSLRVWPRMQSVVVAAPTYSLVLQASALAS